MTPTFLAAVIDTLLPGDDVLPSGTRAGVTIAAQAAHEAVLSAISVQAGGGDAFAAATENKRIEILRAVERAAPDAFRALLTAVLSDYYEAPPALAALGWRSEPPQPTGHRVTPLDNSAIERSERVRRRSKLWRDA